MDNISYEIIINNAEGSIDRATYEGKYKHKPADSFVSFPIKFNVNINNAYICISDSDSPIDRVRDFSADEIRDTFRKVYLYHLLHFGKELSVHTITLKINGEETTISENDGVAEFPYMFSMLTIPDTFKLNTFDDELIFKIIETSKTQQYKRDEYAGLYAFLGGIGKLYVNDRFIYYWTAINAFYNCISSCYNNKLYSELAEDPDYTALSEKDQKELRTFLHLGYDEKNMNALAILYAKDPNVKKIRPTMLKTTSENKRDDENFIINTMSAWLQNWNNDWDALLTALKEYTPGSRNENIDKLKTDLLVKFRCRYMDPYAWMVFQFPYIFRCNSFHGSRAYLAFAGYNEPELLMDEAMCYCMGDFLNENIHKLFKDELITDDEYAKLKYMCANYISIYNLSEDAQNYLFNKDYVERPRVPQRR